MLETRKTNIIENAEKLKYLEREYDIWLKVETEKEALIKEPLDFIWDRLDMLQYNDIVDIIREGEGYIKAELLFPGPKEVKSFIKDWIELKENDELDY